MLRGRSCTALKRRLALGQREKKKAKRWIPNPFSCSCRKSRLHMEGCLFVYWRKISQLLAELLVVHISIDNSAVLNWVLEDRITNSSKPHNNLSENYKMFETLLFWICLFLGVLSMPFHPPLPFRSKPGNEGKKISTSLRYLFFLKFWLPSLNRLLLFTFQSPQVGSCFLNPSQNF